MVLNAPVTSIDDVLKAKMNLDWNEDLTGDLMIVMENTMKTNGTIFIQLKPKGEYKIVLSHDLASSQNNREKRSTAEMMMDSSESDSGFKFFMNPDFKNLGLGINYDLSPKNGKISIKFEDTHGFWKNNVFEKINVDYEYSVENEGVGSAKGKTKLKINYDDYFLEIANEEEVDGENSTVSFKRKLNTNIGFFGYNKKVETFEANYKMGENRSNCCIKKPLMGKMILLLKRISN